MILERVLQCDPAACSQRAQEPKRRDAGLRGISPVERRGSLMAAPAN